MSHSAIGPISFVRDETTAVFVHVEFEHHLNRARRVIDDGGHPFVGALT